MKGNTNLLVAVGLVLTSTAHAIAAAELRVSIGVRETGVPAAIGGDGGVASVAGGGIVWINKDTQSLPLDGQWHQFTFHLGSDPMERLSGTLPVPPLNTAIGTLEHIRFLNSSGLTVPLAVWIDDVQNTFGGTSQTFGTFEGYGDNATVMFRYPHYSNIGYNNLLHDSTAGVDNTVAHTGTGSLKLNWTFIDNDPTRWSRETTYAVPMQPMPQGNPTISFTSDSVVSFWLLGVPEPATLSLLTLGGLIGLRRRGSIAQPVSRGIHGRRVAQIAAMQARSRTGLADRQGHPHL